MATPRRSFKTLFCGNDQGALLKAASISGSLQSSGIRSIAWVYFLGEFKKGTPDELFLALNDNRSTYKQLVQHHIIDPHSTQHDEDPTFNNPLSQVEDSPWNKFFQNAELEKVINQDIERCYPDKDFFQTDEVRELMSRILFIYAKLNPHLSYRQGMHELLAPIVYILHHERCITDLDPDDPQISLEPEEESVLSKIQDAKSIEADAFFIFKHLMDITGDWFAPLPTSSTQQGAKKGRVGGPDNEEAATAVVIKCRRIQHTLLKNKDPELHDHLVALKIEPQFYLLRWVRLLFGREFHLDDLVLIWDAVFAHSPDLVLVDYLCVAMLVFIREQLLERDSTGCLTRLMKYPPVEDVRLFIVQAQTLISNRLQLPQQFTHAPSPQLAPHQAPAEKERPSSNSHSPSPSTPIKSKDKSRARSNSKGGGGSSSSGFDKSGASSQAKALQSWSAANSSIKHMLNVDINSTDVHSLQEQLRTLRDTQLAVAQRIEGIVQNIQSTILSNEALANADILVSVAELKQAKDILCGFLPVSEPVESKYGHEDDDDEVDIDDTPLGESMSRVAL